MPVKSLITIHQAYELLQKSNSEIKKLQKNIQLFKKGISKKVSPFLIESSSPIQCIVVGGNHPVKKLAEQLQNKGFDVRPILNPTVPKGKERLRICIHVYNTEKEIKSLSTAINGHFTEKNSAFVTKML